MKTGRIGAWLAGLSDRERKLVLGGGALLAVAALLFGGVMLSRRVSALEEEVAGNDTALREVAAGKVGVEYLSRVHAT